MSQKKDELNHILDQFNIQVKYCIHFSNKNSCFSMFITSLRGTVVYMWWLVPLTLDLKVGCSSPSPCHRVVYLDKKLYLTSLHAGLTINLIAWLPLGPVSLNSQWPRPK